MDPSRLAFTLSAVSGAAQLAGWALALLPFYASAAPAMIVASGGGDFRVALSRDSEWSAWIQGGWILASMTSATTALVHAERGLSGRPRRPLRTAGIALAGALLLLPYAVSSAAQRYVEGLGMVLGAVALLAALAALVAAWRAPARDTPG